MQGLELLGGGLAQEDLQSVGEGSPDVLVEHLVDHVDDGAGVDDVEGLDRLEFLESKLTLLLHVSRMKQKSSMKSRIS